MTSYIAPSIIFLLFLAVFKIFDKRLAPPAIIFVLGFVSATFLYSLSIIALDVDSPSFAPHNFDLSVKYSTACFAGLLIGYIAHGLIKPIRIKNSIYTIKPIGLSKNNQLVLMGLVLAYFLITLTNHPILSDGDYIRGESSYVNDSDVGLYYRISFIVSQTYAPLVLALYVISFGSACKYSTLKNATVISIVAIVGLTLLSFDRHQAMSIVLMMMVFYHYRIKPVKIKHLFGLLLAMLALQAMRLLRSLNVSITSVNFVDVFNVLLEADWILIVTGPFVALGGWDVLTNVFDLVPGADGYKYGATYLNSIVGLLMPRALGLGTYGAETPSVWYVNLYAPGTTGHGFDFSMVAETYINFGLAGCVAFVLIGYILRTISNNILQSSAPVMIIFSIIVLEVITFALRMDSNSLFKGVVFRAGAIAMLISMMSTTSRTVSLNNTPYRSPR